MAEQSQPPFHSEGILTNPVANTLLADSGALPEGVHTFSYIAVSSVQARVQFEWRKVDATVKHAQPLVLAAASPFMHAQPTALSIVCEEGDRFVIVMGPAAIAGLAQASLCVA